MEVEAKFSIPDEQTFQRLLEVDSLADFHLGGGRVADIRDHYLDTAGRDILARGYACRVRRENGRFFATLKGLGETSGAVHRRVEHEVELPEHLPPEAWPPSRARKLALTLSGGRPLQSLFLIDQTRYRRPLRADERTLAEINLDRVRVHHAGVALLSFLEFEAELRPDGSEADLSLLAAELQAGWELQPVDQSKFERGLSAVGEGPVIRLDAPGIEPDDPMSEAGRKTFRFHFRRMLHNEPGTRLGEDIEALHDMRVATRRMRAAFRVFGDFYEPEAVGPYLKGLKRTGRALGAVRDLDVFREKVRAYLETLPESEQDSLDELLAALETRREAARRRMLAYLDGKKYRRFVKRFGEFVETEGMGGRPISIEDDRPRPYRVRHVAPVAVYERLAAVRAYDEWVRIADPPLERLHRLRIACKRLRYTLEFFREVLGPEAKAAIKEIVAVQDHLGALQDAVVASDILRDFLTYGTWGKETKQGAPGPPDFAPGVEAYLVAKQVEIDELLAEFPRVWQQLRSAEFSRKVAGVVAVL